MAFRINTEVKSYVNKPLVLFQSQLLNLPLATLKLFKSLNFQNMWSSSRGSLFVPSVSSARSLNLQNLFLAVFFHVLGLASLLPPSTSMPWPLHLKQPSLTLVTWSGLLISWFKSYSVTCHYLNVCLSLPTLDVHMVNKEFCLYCSLLSPWLLRAQCLSPSGYLVNIYLLSQWNKCV